MNTVFHVHKAKRNRLWHIYKTGIGFANTTIGFVHSRKEATKIAAMLAGWSGKVEVHKKSYEGDAWRLTA